MRRNVLLIGTAVMLLVLALTVGCSGEKAEASVCAGCGAEMDAKDATMMGDAMMCAGCAEKKAEEPVVARHDCAGGCGMTDWPEDQMTAHDGQWYCKGCAANLPEGEAGSDDDGHVHDESDGHTHG